MSNNNNTALMAAVTAIAAMGVISLPLLQSDTASRFLLNSKQLQIRRVKEYLYRWDKMLKTALLRNAHDPQMDTTKVFFVEQDIHDFIETKLLLNNIFIMSIEQYNDDMEYHVFLRDATTSDIYQLPLVKFGVMLAETMEQQLTSTTLCFVADASSGLGGQVMSTVLLESKAGGAVITEPLWMAVLAHLVEQKVVSREKMERILFGLCRLEAWRVREHVGVYKLVECG